MAFYALGGAEAGAATGASSGVYTGASAIVATPTLAGSYCYEVDPVNAASPPDIYGPWSRIPQPSLLVVQFMFRFAAVFDATVAIGELGQTLGDGNYARQLNLNTSEELVLADADGDSIATTAGAPYLAVNTNYWFLWYVDLRVEAASRDIVWVFKGGAWDKAIDVSNHGDGLFSNIDLITFGSNISKTLPTSGGPFYVDEMAVQALNVTPNTTALGSVTTKFKVPSADGTDQDFDSGSPDFNDVDEIPPDGAATTDIGDAVDEKNSYAITDAGGGETPLAIQVIGQGQRNAGSQANIRTYIYDGSTRDNGDTWNIVGGYRVIYDTANPAKTYNEVNGATITESLFNTLEAGIELTVSGGGGTVAVSQIGLEYIIDGPKALPGGFPTIGPRMVEVAGGAALGSANPTVF